VEGSPSWTCAKPTSTGPGARLIPRGLLELRARQELPDRDARIVVHCALGGPGAPAAKALRAVGCTNVANVEGGTKVCREKDFEVEGV
jgi:phage shock protein E